MAHSLVPHHCTANIISGARVGTHSRTHTPVPYSCRFRMAPPIEERVIAKIRSSGADALPRDFIAWHVRHGDKVVEKHKTFGADQFLPYLKSMEGLSPSACMCKTGFAWYLPIGVIRIRSKMPQRL